MYREKKKSWCSSDFAIVPNSLVKNKDLNSTAKLVFVAITAHARRKDGQAHILAKTIAEELGISERSVTRAIANLKEVGYLEVRQNWGAAWYYCKTGPDAVSCAKPILGLGAFKEIEEYTKPVIFTLAWDEQATAFMGRYIDSGDWHPTELKNIKERVYAGGWISEEVLEQLRPILLEIDEFEKS